MATKRRSTCTHIVGFSTAAYKRLDRIVAALETLHHDREVRDLLAVQSFLWLAHDALRIAGQQTGRPLADETLEIYVREVAKAISQAART